MNFLKEKEKLITPDSPRIWCPDYPTRAFLMQTITLKHLFLLNYSLYVSYIIELPVWAAPGCLTRSLLLNPHLLAT